MTENDISHILKNAIPDDPGTAGLGDRVRRAHRRRRVVGGVAVAAAVVAIGVPVAMQLGSTPNPTAAATHSPSPTVAPVSTPAGVDPSAVTSVSIAVDGPSYSSIADLAKASVAVAKVEIIRSESQLEYPNFDSDDPMINPYIGTGETPSAAEIEEMAIPVTLHHVRVTSVEAGSLHSGDEIVILELGGVVDGVTYEVSDLPKLNQEQLLFLNATPTGKYETVAGGQGRFIPDSQGGYVSATSPDLSIDAAGLSELPSLIGP